MPPVAAVALPMAGATIGGKAEPGATNAADDDELLSGDPLISWGRQIALLVI